MKMFVGGQWREKTEEIEVRNPYDDSVVGTVPRGDPGDIALAVGAAVEGAKHMRDMPAYERWKILRRVGDLLLERQAEFARIISAEEGKILAEANIEVARAAEIFHVSAEEGKRLLGEVLPLDAAPGGAGKLGFTLRVPCGVVAAISPFNFPLHLVAHKLGPALAAGNAVVLKPASDTPLSALKLVALLLEAEVPPLAIHCVTGPGVDIGGALCADPRVRKVSFTGSCEVGEAICRAAGMKKVTMELGSNSPLVIMDDADLEQVAEATVATGYQNAGQVCISTQRVLADSKVYQDFLDVLKPRVEAINTGDQLLDGTGMGPVVREVDAVRIETWIREAVEAGARLVAGGSRCGTLVEPTVLADVEPDMRVSRDELFGPAVVVTRFDSVADAIRLANDTEFGLSAGIFTRDLDRAMHFARKVESGNIHINWGPQWRADLMPYGGLKKSGYGKEGPRYAVEEMTELKMVVVHLKT